MALNSGLRDGLYDLHTHTTASDGRQTPEENVRIARDSGLAGLAITDHDTVNGISEAVEAGESYGIEVIPGVEISTNDDGKDVHVLGYWIDPSNEVFRLRLESQREARFQRNELIITNLQRLGFHVTLAEAEAIAAERRNGKDRAVGRPHMAELLVRKGYVASVEAAFETLLGEGGAAYASVPRVSPETAIGWIQDAGGGAVLAHPGLYKSGEAILRRLAAAGLDGVETAHADHDEDQERLFQSIAGSLGLFATAGSDFHGFRDGIAFHAPMGSRTVQAAAVQQLYARIAGRKRGNL